MNYRRSGISIKIVSKSDTGCLLEENRREYRTSRDIVGGKHSVHFQLRSLNISSQRTDKHRENAKKKKQQKTPLFHFIHL